MILSLNLNDVEIDEQISGAGMNAVVYLFWELDEECVGWAGIWDEAGKRAKAQKRVQFLGPSKARERNMIYVSKLVQVFKNNMFLLVGEKQWYLLI